MSQWLVTHYYISCLHIHIHIMYIYVLPLPYYYRIPYTVLHSPAYDYIYIIIEYIINYLWIWIISMDKTALTKPINANAYQFNQSIQHWVRHVGIWRCQCQYINIYTYKINDLLNSWGFDSKTVCFDCCLSTLYSWLKTLDSWRKHVKVGALILVSQSPQRCCSIPKHNCELDGVLTSHHSPLSRAGLHHCHWHDIISKHSVHGKYAAELAVEIELWRIDGPSFSWAWQIAAYSSMCKLYLCGHGVLNYIAFSSLV